MRARRPGPAIVDEARQGGADVIYLGTVHAPPSERALGPTAAYVLAHRPCRVIVETPPAQEAGRRERGAARGGGGMSWRHRLAARWRAEELDGLLVLGVPLRGRPTLAARAEQVTSPRGRHALAVALEAAVAEARDGARRPAAAPLAGEAVRREAPALLGLAHALRTAGSVEARGVALARRLVCAYGSPLTDQAPRQELGAAVERAVSALGPGAAEVAQEHREEADKISPVYAAFRRGRPAEPPRVAGGHAKLRT